MTRYLIIGCGRFGSRAVRILIEKHSLSKIIVVDKNEEAFQRISNLPAEKVVCDGLLYLDQALSDGSIDYIIPAVPFHLAFEFILLRLKPFGAKRVSVPPLQNLPNLVIGKTGDLYGSLADFLCPGDCPEPPHYCTVTGKKRSEPLFKILMEMKGPFHSMVIRSRQLGAGVGGFRFDVLRDLVETIRRGRQKNPTYWVSTSCRCHAVISALSF